MTSLTFYGGVGEIGGTKILLKDKNAKIFLDFGEPFDFGEGYFACMYGLRTVNGMEVFFKLGLMPKIEKLYSKDMLRFAPMRYQKPDIDGIFVTHCHCDHINHVKYVDENIPIHIGHGTLKILESLKTIGRPHSFKTEEINFKTFKSGDTIKVKHLRVQPVHVDHSIPAAYGYIVKTSKGNIAYTGDMRFHGPMAKMSEEFVKKAKKAKPIALICEGTRVGLKDPVVFKSERWVRDKINETIKNTKGLVFGYFSSTNIDRLVSFYEAAIRNGRKFVVDYKVAEILNNLKGKVNVPDILRNKNVLVYYRMERSGTFQEKDYWTFARKYWKKRVTADYIHKHQNELVMMLSFYALMELIYIKPAKGASFVYSLSDLFWEGDDNEAMRTAVENWMKLFGIKMIHAHASGHASGEEIKKLIKEINPKTLIPVHTEHPEMFKKFHKNVVLPEVGKEMHI